MKNDEWCFDDERLSHHAMEFFRNLYTVDYSVNGLYPFRGKLPSLSSSERDGLLIMTTDEKTKRVVFSMNPLKAPGVNRFHAKFYQS